VSLAGDPSYAPTLRLKLYLKEILAGGLDLAGTEEPSNMAPRQVSSR
jgi:hypothetical protein